MKKQRRRGMLLALALALSMTLQVPVYASDLTDPEAEIMTETEAQGEMPAVEEGQTAEENQDKEESSASEEETEESAGETSTSGEETTEAAVETSASMEETTEESQKETTAAAKKKKTKYGPTKVKGKWYLYNKKGKKAAGTLKNGTYTCKQDKVTYYLTSKKVIEARKKGSTYYYANGKKMSEVDAYNFKTELTARKIAAKITKKCKTKADKKRACFDWVVAKYYCTPRKFTNTKGWPAVYANDHFKNGKGNCISDAAAFAYLAKAIGYKDVYVCTDSKTEGCHAWCEIDGKVYDPLFAQTKAHGGYAKNYGVGYKSKGGCYPLSAILHIAI